MKLELSSCKFYQLCLSHTGRNLLRAQEDSDRAIHILGKVLNFFDKVIALT